MLTLDNLLAQKHVSTSFSAGIERLQACSLFSARLLSKDADLLNDLLQNHQQAYVIAEMQHFLDAAAIVDEQSLKKALRQLRQRVIVRTIYRDLNSLADLQEVLQTTTHLAEVCIVTAVRFNYAWLQTNSREASRALNFSRDGFATLVNGFIVVGMGKLGGGELNVSSDIDLIFAYDENLDWQQEISQPDFYNRLAKKVISALDEVTEDGFVFRVDMRLRPFGSEGVLASSVDALEDYYQNHGREWERYAWIKGRVIYPQNIVQNYDLGANIHALLRPFVFRKYLDYNALASMRELKQQIHRDVLQKGQTDNIKLGRGGIREIEFIAQVFQLMRGGRDTSLQIKPTLAVLALLKDKGLLPEKTVGELSEAYVFLRNLEHRLMYVDDAQTQELPRTDEAKARIAKAMNFADWETFLIKLNSYRQSVQQHFDATFTEAKTSQHASKDSLEAEKSVWNGTLTISDAEQALQKLGYSDAQETYRRLNTLHQANRYLQLPELSRLRFDALMPHVISLAAAMPNPETTLMRVMDLLESICRRASYLALLAEHAQAMHLVVKLCSSSPWLANYLTQHPILLDELLDTRTLYAAPDFVAMRSELEKRMAEAAGDVERQMDMMRHFKHATVFRFAAQDINGELALETLSDYLSALADLILSVSLETIWQNVRGKHIDVPKFAVIGYGKLGGKELGYASDLDIIFLYDDDGDHSKNNRTGDCFEAGEVYARFAQRINNWFNSLTSAGLLYETDLQLRPDGNSGLLVSTVAAFKDYQLNKAWVWEHQAITRARFVAGDSKIGKAFEQIRIEVLTQVRDAEKLKADVLSMREKMRQANVNKSNLFDLKHDKGAIIDVEFLVQYLVLAYAEKYPQLTENIGNIALLKLLASLNIIPTKLAEQVATAYREYRHMQHMLKLQGVTNNRVEPVQVKEHADKVIGLWQLTLASPA